MLTSTTASVRSRFDFLKYRYIWLMVSVAYFLIGAVAYYVKGGFVRHIDFAGGTELNISFERPIDISTVRNIMSKRGWKDAIIQSSSTTGSRATGGRFLVRVGGDDAVTEDQIKEAFAQGASDNKLTIDAMHQVGPEAGSDTTRNAIYAVLLALLVLLLYIAVRFEFRFGIGAVISLIHDLLAVMVFILLTGEPISLHVLASILAVLGYSLNDTIVIFARIRENYAKHKGMSEYDMVNLSINQTLRRTLLTSFATTLAVLAIVLLGGDHLRGLSVVMLVGIIVGTYSSIYIASPAMLAIKTKN